MIFNVKCAIIIIENKEITIMIYEFDNNYITEEEYDDVQ